MKSHLGCFRNVPPVGFTSIGDVRGSGFHISRVVGGELCCGRVLVYTRGLRRVTIGRASPMGGAEGRGVL